MEISMTTVQENRLATLAAGLRELADWLDSNPDVDLREFETIELTRSTQGSDEDDEAEVAQWAAAMGVTPEWTSYGHLIARRNFGTRLAVAVTHVPSAGHAEWRARQA